MVNEHDHTAIIEARFEQLGLRLSYGEHVDVRDDFDSSPVADRVTDLHAAFADREVAAILTVIGGFNSNELLPLTSTGSSSGRTRRSSAATPTSRPC